MSAGMPASAALEQQPPRQVEVPEVALSPAARPTVVLISALSWASAAMAQEPGSLSVELNKLEPLDKGCRAYIVIDNKAAADYETLKLDLFMFRPDGVIGRRFAIDLAPLRGEKRTVKLFDLGGAACEEVGNFLLNDVLECKTAGTSPADCLARIAPSSRATAKLTK